MFTSKKHRRQHAQLSKKFEYCKKLMDVADIQLEENPDLIEVDLYEMIVDDYYAAKHNLSIFHNRMQRMSKLEHLNALK